MPCRDGELPEQTGYWQKNPARIKSTDFIRAGFSIFYFTDF